MKTITLKDKVQVSDPCYDADEFYAKTLKNVLGGEWAVDVEKKDCNAWGERIAKLTARHIDYLDCEIDELKGACAVDSGQCGIFNYDYYEENCEDDEFEDLNSWYRRVCELTLNEPYWGTIENEGVVASSGFGDGLYPLYIAKNEEGKIVGIEVVFIGEEEDF